MKPTTNRTIYASELTNKIGKVYSEKALSEICSASDSSLFWEWSTESSSGLFPFKHKMEKKCFKCGELKPLNEFYKHPGMADGRVNKCKECNKADVQQNYRKNIQYYKEYEKNRATLPHRVEALRVYQQTHPEIVQACKQRWIENNPEKRAAHTAVRIAIRGGRLTPQPCEQCGKQAQAHHDDYSKQLEVRWLCSKHHAEHHKNERRKASGEKV